MIDPRIRNTEYMIFFDPANEECSMENFPIKNLEGTVSRDFLLYFLLLYTISVLSIQTLTVLNFLVNHKCAKTNVNAFGYF